MWISFKVLPAFGLASRLPRMDPTCPQVRVGDADGVFERWVVVRADPLGCRRVVTPRDHAADDNAVQCRGSPGRVPGLRHRKPGESRA